MTWQRLGADPARSPRRSAGDSRAQKRLRAHLAPAFPASRGLALETPLE
jgi:hypothetical protein